MGTRNTRIGLAVVGSLLAALAVTAPAQAAPGGAGAGCKPSLQILERLSPAEDPHPSPWVRRTQVSAIAPGPSRLAVGMSGLQPVYWIGTRVFAVPLPAGSGPGALTDVNRSGLMVGKVLTSEGSKAFSYRHGDRAITVLPGGGAAYGVNDHGVIIGNVWDVARNRTIAMEWSGTRIRRELPAPAGYRIHFMSGINNAGQAVGNGETQEPLPGTQIWITSGLHWSADPRTAPRVLQPADHTGDHYVTRGIDESGRIVGYQKQASVDGSEVAVMWNRPDGPLCTRPGRPAPWAAPSRPSARTPTSLSAWPNSATTPRGRRTARTPGPSTGPAAVRCGSFPDSPRPASPPRSPSPTTTASAGPPWTPRAGSSR